MDTWEVEAYHFVQELYTAEQGSPSGHPVPAKSTQVCHAAVQLYALQQSRNWRLTKVCVKSGGQDSGEAAASQMDLRGSKWSREFPHTCVAVNITPGIHEPLAQLTRTGGQGFGGVVMSMLGGPGWGLTHEVHIQKTEESLHPKAEKRFYQSQL
jgi:hypothetical protein